MLDLFRTLLGPVKQGFPEITTVPQCEELLAAGDLIIIFKHSSACGTSWMAHREVTKFQKLRPDAKVVLLSVLRSRGLSSFVAERLATAHESPQVLVVRRGQLVASASHDDVTADFLDRAVSKYDNEPSESSALS